jgi:UDP-2-acetamido-3-amino-2,3-dideoxy-glucuronate N-acetyltransferase
MSARIMPSADVDERADIGDGSSVWHLAQVREGAKLGVNCIIGRGAYIDTGVILGDSCKVQNYALVYAPAEIGEGVFIGPAAVLTNDMYPRAIAPDGGIKSGDDWHAAGVKIGDGAAIGARAVVVAGVQIGAWALVGAGAVVTKDVKPHALVVGVPAKQVGWVGHAGVPLEVLDDDSLRCPNTGQRYIIQDDQLMETS